MLARSLILILLAAPPDRVTTAHARRLRAAVSPPVASPALSVKDAARNAATRSAVSLLSRGRPETGIEMQSVARAAKGARGDVAIDIDFDSGDSSAPIEIVENDAAAAAPAPSPRDNKKNRLVSMIRALLHPCFLFPLLQLLFFFSIAPPTSTDPVLAKRFNDLTFKRVEWQQAPYCAVMEDSVMPHPILGSAAIEHLPGTDVLKRAFTSTLLHADGVHVFFNFALEMLAAWKLHLHKGHVIRVLLLFVFAQLADLTFAGSVHAFSSGIGSSPYGMTLFAAHYGDKAGFGWVAEAEREADVERRFLSDVLTGDDSTNEHAHNAATKRLKRSLTSEKLRRFCWHLCAWAVVLGGDILSLLDLSPGGGSVGHLAHIGGLTAGFSLGLAGILRRTSDWRRLDGRGGLHDSELSAESRPEVCSCPWCRGEAFVATKADCCKACCSAPQPAASAGGHAGVLASAVIQENKKTCRRPNVWQYLAIGALTAFSGTVIALDQTLPNERPVTRSISKLWDTPSHDPHMLFARGSWAYNFFGASTDRYEQPNACSMCCDAKLLPRVAMELNKEWFNTTRFDDHLANGTNYGTGEVDILAPGHYEAGQPMPSESFIKFNPADVHFNRVKNSNAVELKDLLGYVGLRSGRTDSCRPCSRFFDKSSKGWQPKN